MGLMGCSALAEQVKDHGMIVAYEGLQPFSGDRAHSLARDVARQTGLVAVEAIDRPGYMALARAARDAGRDIYIIGYSLGGSTARGLAELCKSENIRVAGLFLLDPGVSGVFVEKIPSNVDMVVFYTSPGYGVDLPLRPRSLLLEDPRRTIARFEHLGGSNHMDLPGDVAWKIGSAIGRR